MPSRRADRLVVHVSLDESVKQWGQSIEEAVTQTCRLKECLERFQRGWDRPSSDEAVLVTAASEHEKLRSLLTWVERLRDAVRSQAHRDVSVGIASTRLAARVAARLARPRGLMLLLPGYERALISSVRLEELDELRPEQAALLRRKGIRTLGGLAEIEPNEVRALLGPEAAKLIGLVRGLDSRADRVWGGRLARAVSVLCRRTAKKLRVSGLGARGLELSLVYRDGVSLERYILLARPASSARELESAARTILPCFPTRQEPVVGMSLAATGLSPRPGQLPLFVLSKEIRVHLGRI